MTPEEAGALYDSQMGGSSVGLSAEEAGALYDSQLTTPSLEATNIGGEGLTKFRPAVVGATARNILDYMTLGGADEIVGGGNAAIDYLFSNPEKKSIGELYDSRKAQSQLASQALEEQLPDASTASKAIGLAASLRMPLPGVKTNKTGVAGILSKTGQNAAIGAGLSELQAGLSTDGDLMTRLNAASEAAPIGALFGAGGGLLGEGIAAVGNKLTKEGKKFQLASFGTGARDIKDAGKRIPQTVEGATSESPLFERMDNIIKAGALKNGMDPGDVQAVLRSQNEKLGTELGSILTKADDLGANAVKTPGFEGTRKYILENFEGDDLINAKEIFQKQASSLLGTVGEKGGKLTDWQKAKQNIQKTVNYDASGKPGVTQKIRDEIASDLRQFIEDESGRLIPNKAGEVSKINQQIADRKIFDKILQKTKDGEEGKTLLNRFRDISKTTGGFGSTIVASAVAGSADYGSGGSVSSALKTGALAGLLSTRKGQYLTGSLLRKAGEKGASINPATLGLLGIASQKPESKAPAQPLDQALSQLIAPTESDQLAPGQDLSLSDIQEEDMPKAEDIKLDVLPTDKTKRIKTVENLIDSDPVDATIYQIESNRNPKAKNPESSASGGFQLLKKTAATLGVKDVFDLADNYKGYLKLKEENQNVLSNLGLDPQDPEALYSLHYLGSPVFRKVALKKPLTETEQEQVAYLKKTVLPRFRKIYTQKTMMV